MNDYCRINPSAIYVQPRRYVFPAELLQAYLPLLSALKDRYSQTFSGVGGWVYRCVACVAAVKGCGIERMWQIFDNLMTVPLTGTAALLQST